MLHGRKRLVAALTGLAATVGVSLVPSTTHADPDIDEVETRALPFQPGEEPGDAGPATDIVCPMYPAIDAIAGWAERTEETDEQRPLVMCEFSHAMGNSNGSLADYWAVIDDCRISPLCRPRGADRAAVRPSKPVPDR